MEHMARWLVCAGAGSFPFIAAALTAAGHAGGIEWESDPARACARAAELRSAPEPVHVLVGPCDGVGAPDEVACALAGLAGGTTVLCTADAGCSARVTARGVAAVVAPADLARYLMGAPSRGEGGRAAPAEEAAGGCAAGPDSGTRPAAPRARPAAPAASGGAPEGASPVRAAAAGPTMTGEMVKASGGDDLEEPPGVCCRRDDAPAPAGEPAPTGMRAMGRLPRTGVSGHPRTASSPEPRGPVAGGGSSGAGASGPGAPAGGPDGPGAAGEPVVYRPLVRMPQFECAVAGEDRHVPTVCFASSRGGVGKSALAALTALALARDGLNVALVDLDLQFGTCLGYLGADETDGLIDVGAPPEQVRVDARTLARCRTTPEPCLAAYEFCRVPEQAELLSGIAGRLLRAARAGADIAVVDLPSGVNEVVAQVLDEADRCLLVTDQRAFALESLAAQQALCARMGVARTKLVTVMNRCDPRHRDEGFLSRAQFEVQTPQIVRVVDGGPEVMQMLAIGSAGELLAMRNRFALSASDAAHALCADLGCQPAPYAPAVHPRPQPAQPPAAVPAREGVFRKFRKEKRGEQVVCPF